MAEVPAERCISQALGGKRKTQQCKTQDNGYSENEAEEMIPDYAARVPVVNVKGQPVNRSPMGRRSLSPGRTRRTHVRPAGRRVCQAVNRKESERPFERRRKSPAFTAKLITTTATQGG